MLYSEPVFFSFRMIIGKYLLHQSKLYQVTQKKKERKKKSLRFEAKRIFETSLTMKTIRIPQGRKKNKKLFRIVFEDYFLKKSGNNVNVFSLGILLFARLIESSIIAYSRFCRVLGPRLLCLVKIINMEKISVEPRRFTRFSCFS